MVVCADPSGRRSPPWSTRCGAACTTTCAAGPPGHPGGGGRRARHLPQPDRLPSGQAGRGGPPDHRATRRRATSPAGRGRTPKVYEPAAEGVHLSIPQRRYDLVGEILADAVATAPGDAAKPPPSASPSTAATSWVTSGGPPRRAARAGTPAAVTRSSGAAPRSTGLGYEPRPEDAGTVALVELPVPRRSPSASGPWCAASTTPSSRAPGRARGPRTQRRAAPPRPVVLRRPHHRQLDPDHSRRGLGPDPGHNYPVVVAGQRRITTLPECCLEGGEVGGELGVAPGEGGPAGRGFVHFGSRRRLRARPLGPARQAAGADLEPHQHVGRASRRHPGRPARVR